MLGKMQPTQKQSIIPIETGDILTVHCKRDGSLSFDIRVVGITHFGEFPTPDRQNYLFGTIIGEPDAILRVDFKQAVVDYNGADSFRQLGLFEVHCNGHEIKYKPANETLAPCKVSTSTIHEFVPCKVGDILKKRSSEYTVVYVNENASTVVIENIASGKVEQINQRDTSAVKAFDLISK